MNVVKATRLFEDWLALRTPIDKKDLRLKHANMKADVFMFLRATYYRWAQLWPQICPDLAQAPRALAVGDLHVENFGTWRDIEGRLIWGVNDFDEAWPMAYTIDLVRLAVSAHLAVEAGRLPLKREDICDTLLEGYHKSMREKGCAFVLGENHRWLRLIAEGELRDPVRFWQKMDALPTVKAEVPVSAVDALEHLMPAPGISYRLTHRTAGLGSLGHARYVAIADWHGARIAREEIFGPVATVIPFEDEKDAVKIANDSPYGLAAAVWTRDIYKAFRAVKAIRAGIVWVNHMQPTYVEAPWGGYKQSGFGRELGPGGIEEYLETKQVHINLNEAPIGWY